jgi:hypothetical protein
MEFFIDSRKVKPIDAFTFLWNACHRQSVGEDEANHAWDGRHHEEGREYIGELTNYRLEIVA